MAEVKASFTVAVNPAVPPYAPYRSFRNFTDSLKQGIPARIDRSVMASMSGALQSQLTTALRYLNLISANGLPTAQLPRLVNSEGAERVSVLREIVVAAYPFLFKSFDLKSATPRMVQEQFSAQGASGGTLDKCMVFFLSAAKDAEIELSPHLKVQRGGPRIVRQRQRSNRAADTVNNGDNQALDNGSAISDLSWEQMLLTKFPSFDPAWPDEVKSKWFDGFHRLMRVGKPEDEKE